MLEKIMKMQSVKREWESPVFCLKKHCCPCCGRSLVKMKTETIVHSGSEEAKKYDFSCGDAYLCGNVKFIRTAFYCPGCEKTYVIPELKELEGIR